MRIKREEIFQGLIQLRKSLFHIIITLISLGIIIYPFSKSLLRQLYKTNLQSDLVAFGIPEAFFSILKLTLYSSLFLSIPIIFYKIWTSFAPIFRLKGLKSTISIPLAAIFLFYLGDAIHWPDDACPCARGRVSTLGRRAASFSAATDHRQRVLRRR